MKIFVVVILAFTLLLVAEAKRINYKKEYCGNEVYVGNPPKTSKEAKIIGRIYPHLHCDKDFLTLSRIDGKHNNLKGDCNKVNEILGDIDGFYGKARKPCTITAVLVKYRDDDCPTQSKLENLLQFLQN